MEKKIELKIPKTYGDVYLSMSVPQDMKASGLLQTIGANNITEFNPHSSRCGSEELKDHAKYNVFTNNFNRTLDLIKNYKNRNQSNFKTYIEFI